MQHSRTIPTVDDVPVWSIICIVIRPSFRCQGLARELLAGAIRYARERGAPALEAYPLDPQGGRVGPAFAYVGTSDLFQSVGCERVVKTSSKSGSMTRWLMRLQLGE